MSDRDEALAALRMAAGGIDPVLDQTEAYVRAVKSVQAVTRKQGQVMSQALDNNFLLYHTNKKLTAQHREMSAELRANRLELEELRRAHAELRKTFEESGGDRWRALYEHTRRVLTAHLHEAMAPEELERRLSEMAEQARELAELPERVTEQELQQMEVIPAPEPPQ